MECLSAYPKIWSSLSLISNKGLSSRELTIPDKEKFENYFTASFCVKFKQKQNKIMTYD